MIGRGKRQNPIVFDSSELGDARDMFGKHMKRMHETLGDEAC